MDVVAVAAVAELLTRMRSLCELHIEEVVAVENQAGAVCFLKEDNDEEAEGTELNSAEHYFPHLILLAMILNLYVLEF